MSLTPPKTRKFRSTVHNGYSDNGYSDILNIVIILPL